MEYLKVVLLWIGIFVIPYLLGSVNFGLVVSFLGYHADVRDYGSHNAGMTNVLRTFGKIPALITLVGDFGKTVLGVFISRWLYALLLEMGYSFFGIADFDAACIGGLCALLGHIFPVFFGFRGGKGVMTCCGIIAVTYPCVLVVVLAVFLVFLLSTRYLSLGSIMGAVVYPIAVAVQNLLTGKPLWSELFFALLFSGIVIFKHRTNIRRLLTGTENRFSLHSKPLIEQKKD